MIFNYLEKGFPNKKLFILSILNMLNLIQAQISLIVCLPLSSTLQSAHNFWLWYQQILQFLMDFLILGSFSGQIPLEKELNSLNFLHHYNLYDSFSYLSPTTLRAASVFSEASHSFHCSTSQLSSTNCCCNLGY